MGKLKTVKRVEAPPIVDTEAKEVDLSYHVVSALRLGELIVHVNHYMVTKQYKPIGGARFSDQLGLWTQTVIK